VNEVASMTPCAKQEPELCMRQYGKIKGSNSSNGGQGSICRQLDPKHPTAEGRIDLVAAHAHESAVDSKPQVVKSINPTPVKYQLKNIAREDREAKVKVVPSLASDTFCRTIIKLNASHPR